MKIQLRVEGFELVQGTHEGVEGKIRDIADIFPEDTVYNVVIKRRNNGYKSEIKVQNGRDFIRGEASADKIEYSVSSAVKVLKKRARKIKEMQIDKKRNTFITTKDAVDEVMEEVKHNWGIERVKKIHTPFMTEIEATMELEQLDHDFFIFRSIEREGHVCVLYRRETGYGLIVTE